MSGSGNKCVVCQKKAESRCSLCRQVFYCSKEHQKKDWASHKENCTRKKYVIETNPSGRTGQERANLLTTEEVKPDLILLQEKPLLLSLKVNALEFTPNPVCLGCYKEIKLPVDSESDETSGSEDESGEDEDDDEEVAGECSKCRLPICSKSCEGHHFHKALECAFLSKGKEGSRSRSGVEEILREEISYMNPTTFKQMKLKVRDALLQNLIYFRTFLLKLLPGEGRKEWDSLLRLAKSGEGQEGSQDETDEDRNVTTAIVERTSRIYSILNETIKKVEAAGVVLDDLKKGEVHLILQFLDEQSYHFNLSGGLTEISALFPTFSQIRHSCVPNSKYYLLPCKKRGFSVVVRNGLKLKKGEPLTVSHVNLMWNTEKRREWLKKEKGFWCGCERCLDPLELGSNFSTILCTQENCSAPSLPFLKPTPGSTSTAPLDTYWRCTAPKCGRVTPPWQVKKMDNKMCELVSKAQANLTSYRVLASKLESLVHPDYYLLFVVNHSLLQMYGERDEQNPSENEDVRTQNKKMLEDKVALGNRLLSQVRRLDPAEAKLGIYAAVIYYELQSSILAMSGGEVDDDFEVLRRKPETVGVAKIYLQKCIDCFKYEFLDLPEAKLKKLAEKKMEYLNFILRKFKK